MSPRNSKTITPAKKAIKKEKTSSKSSGSKKTSKRRLLGDAIALVHATAGQQKAQMALLQSQTDALQKQLTEVSAIHKELQKFTNILSSTSGGTAGNATEKLLSMIQEKMHTSSPSTKTNNTVHPKAYTKNDLLLVLLATLGYPGALPLINTYLNSNNSEETCIESPSTSNEHALLSILNTNASPESFPLQFLSQNTSVLGNLSKTCDIISSQSNMTSNVCDNILANTSAQNTHIMSTHNNINVHDVDDFSADLSQILNNDLNSSHKSTTSAKSTIKTKEDYTQGEYQPMIYSIIIRGVRCWRAQWHDPHNGKRRTRQFSEDVHTPEGARLAALAALVEHGSVPAKHREEVDELIKYGLLPSKASEARKIVESCESFFKNKNMESPKSCRNKMSHSDSESLPNFMDDTIKSITDAIHESANDVDKITLDKILQPENFSENLQNAQLLRHISTDDKSENASSDAKKAKFKNNELQALNKLAQDAFCESDVKSLSDDATHSINAETVVV